MAGEMEAHSPGQDARHPFLGNVELTFLGHPFESLDRALDPILAVIAIGRKEPDHLIGAAGGRTGNIAGSKMDGLPDGKFVLQRPLHHATTPATLTVPLATAKPKTGPQPSMAPVLLASYIRA
jgi:hypothetical protein